MNTKQITLNELAQVLSTIDGNPVAIIEMETPKHKHVHTTNADLHNVQPNEVRMYTRLKAYLGSTYATRVNREPKLGNVQAVKGAVGRGSQDWNAHIPYAFFTPIDHNDVVSFYTYKGQQVDDSFLKTILRANSYDAYKRRRASIRTDLIHMTVYLRSITAITFSGVRYEIVKK